MGDHSFAEEPYPGESEEDVHPPLDEEPTSTDRTGAMLCHIGGFFTGFLLPLVLWLTQKGKSRYLDHHAKEALNFQITLMVIYVVVAILLVASILLGFAKWTLLGAGGLAVFLGLYEVVLIILASVAANQGKWFRYPLCLRLVQ